ncbi:MAG: triose-phosphate isomerase [Candidatus Hodarchaeales archaeon]
MRRFVIGGNWKMQISKVEDAESIAEKIAVAINNIRFVDVFIAPSFNALYTVGKAIQNTKLNLSGQNIHYHEKGAFTGQISVLSLLDSGCEYVILGHSEPRRIFNETDEIINLKIRLALEKNLKPVLCIGETAKEREDDRVTEVNEEQLSGSLKGVSKRELHKIVIAYEPVWAINNKFLNPDTEIKPATPQQASEAHQIVRNWIRHNYNAKVAEDIPIIYGGSMNANNADKLLSIDDIDGGLIGGASLSVDTFLPIIQSADRLSGSKKDYQWEDNTLKFKN